MRCTLRQLAMGIAPLTLVACSPAAVGIDGGRDTGTDAPPTQDDVFYPPPPHWNCDDPALWTAPVVAQQILPAFDDYVACYPAADGHYLALPIATPGAPGCARVISSRRADLPLVTFPVGANPTLLGIVAPSEVDVELRTPFLTSDGWGVLSQRGRSNGSTLAVEVPSPWVLEGHVRAVLEWGVYANDAELITLGGHRVAHHDAFAFGHVGAALAFVSPAPEEAATLHLFNLTTMSFDTLPELTLAAPIDATHTFIVPFGVISGTRLLVVRDGVLVSEQALPAVMDDVGTGPDGVFGRSGSTPYEISETGARALTDMRAERVLAGGCLVTAPGEVAVGNSGIMNAFDTAIGTPTSCARGYVVGEHGIAAMHRGPIIGPKARLFDATTAGSIVPGAHPGGYLLLRPDGATEYYGLPDRVMFCE